MTTALEGGEGSALRPGRSLPPGKNPVPIVQEAGWAPGPVWTRAQYLDPTGFDPWTVQPVASRYTDWATGHTLSGAWRDKITRLSLQKKLKKPYFLADK